MPVQVQNVKPSHRRFWLLSALIFFLLSVAAAGPLVYKAFADVSSAHDQAIQIRNAAISEAILQNDYNSWASLVLDETIKTQISADNFDTFAEAYRLLEKGMIDEANLLKRQIGLKDEFSQKAVVSKNISNAIVNQDYVAWRAMVGEDHAKGLVTNENFAAYAKVLTAASEGKFNQVTRGQYDLGIKQKMDYSSSHDDVAEGSGVYGVYLQSVGPNMVAVIKQVRLYTFLDLASAKSLTESAPVFVYHNGSLTDATNFRDGIIAAGGVALLIEE